MANEERLILIFDGVDEVIDYKEQVKDIIETIYKARNYKLRKILITTRSHLKLELEDHFKTISFNLNNFDENDKKNFLIKY